MGNRCPASLYRRTCPGVSTRGSSTPQRDGPQVTVEFRKCVSAFGVCPQSGERERPSKLAAVATRNTKTLPACQLRPDCSCSIKSTSRTLCRIPSGVARLVSGHGRLPCNRVRIRTPEPDLGHVVGWITRLASIKVRVACVCSLFSLRPRWALRRRRCPLGDESSSSPSAGASFKTDRRQPLPPRPRPLGGCISQMSRVDRRHDCRQRRRVLT